MSAHPSSPTPPTYAPDADDAVKKPLLEEARAKAILLASMAVDIALSLGGLSISHLMWAHLRRNCEIRNEALYLAVVEAQSLHQHDSTVEEFHRQMSVVWHHLDILGEEYCVGGTSWCCDHHRGQRDTAPSRVLLPPPP